MSQMTLADTFRDVIKAQGGSLVSDDQAETAAERMEGTINYSNEELRRNLNLIADSVLKDVPASARSIIIAKIFAQRR